MPFKSVLENAFGERIFFFVVILLRMQFIQIIIGNAENGKRIPLLYGWSVRWNGYLFAVGNLLEDKMQCSNVNQIISRV